MSINISITSNELRLKEARAHLQKLAQHKIFVGIPTTSEARKSERSEHNTANIDNATLGYIHEHGSPLHNLPARPHLLPGMKKAASPMREIFISAVKSILAGQSVDVNHVLTEAGEAALKCVRGEFTANSWPPLSPLTLAQKNAQGIARANRGGGPLVDTGQLLAAYTYIIE